MSVYKNKLISTSVYNRIRPVDFHRPWFYALLNLHKHYLPLRPILHIIRSEQHELTEIQQHVSDLFLNHYISDFFKFCNCIRNMSPGQTPIVI